MNNQGQQNLETNQNSETTENPMNSEEPIKEELNKNLEQEHQKREPEKREYSPYIVPQHQKKNKKPWVIAGAIILLLIFGACLLSGTFLSREIYDNANQSGLTEKEATAYLNQKYPGIIVANIWSESGSTTDKIWYFYTLDNQNTQYRIIYQSSGSEASGPIIEDDYSAAYLPK